MPAFTVNRNYPYSVPGDPADVPAALQALAEAVNDDVQALQDLVGPRPMARVRGTTPVQVSGALFTAAQLDFELIDFNIGGAIAPLVNGQVQIQLPGLWFMLATFVGKSAPPAANIDYIGASIVDEANDDLGMTSSHVIPPLGELQRNYDVGASKPVSLPLQNTVFLRGIVQRSSGTTGYQFADRSLTLIRMTES